MDEYDDETQHDDGEAAPGTTEAASRRRRRSEGVRIIGAEEAARALEDGQAAGRRPDDAPRFGDVPERPSGPPPAQRFPLPDAADATTPILRPQAPQSGTAEPPPLQHWTEPPTGEVPRILAPDDGGGEGESDDIDAWAGLPNRAPRWRDQQSDWAETDFDDVVLAGDEAPMGVLDANRTEHSDLFSFDDAEAVPDHEPPPGPGTDATRRRSVTTSIRTRQAPVPPADLAPPGRAGAGRDMPLAVGAGAAMAVVALVLFKAGPGPAMFLVTAVVTLAAAELFHVFTRAGYRPATLLGLVATVGLMAGTYAEGEAAVPLVLFLATTFSFLWYLFRVVRARPSVNVAVTLLGICWVGLLGSFAALMLRMPDRHGIAFLLAAVIATAAHDIGGLFFGTQMGTRPLLPAISPDKTLEGLLGGMFSAVFASVLFVGVLPGISPWTAGKAMVLGLVVAVVAPLGDLCQSMVKRDLGVKDTGSLIPGHGGVLDRFDALLFVLPATYYLVKLLDLA